MGNSNSSENGTTSTRAASKTDRERWRLLLQIEKILDLPMATLGFIWLVLLVIDLTRGLSPFLTKISFLIWGIFILDFGLRLVIAPDRGKFLRKNWITLLSLLVPTLRVFRVLRAFRLLRIARAARGANVVKIVGTVNRGMKALRKSLGKRGFKYVLGLTLIVNVLGAAGIYALERDVPDPSGIHDFGTALWWTAMMLTTMGSQYWPQTPEGRALSLLLSVYAFAVFGYITASVASFLVGREVSGSEESHADQGPTLDTLLKEIRALRSEIDGLRSHTSQSAPISRTPPA